MLPKHSTELAKKNIAMDRRKHKIFDVTRTVGRAKLKWIEKYNLDEHAHPVECIKAVSLTKERNINGT